MIIVPKSYVPQILEEFKPLDTNIKFESAGFPIQTTLYVILIHIF